MGKREVECGICGNKYPIRDMVKENGRLNWHSLQKIS